VTDDKEEKGERSRRFAGNPPGEQELRMMLKQTHHRYAGAPPAPSHPAYGSASGGVFAYSFLKAAKSCP